MGWGLGIFYASGGGGGDYQNVVMGGKGIYEDNTNLQIMEYAAGFGYKVTDDLKIGLTYRIVSAKLSLEQAGAAGGGTYFQESMNNLSDTSYMGFKLGAQYKLSDKTQIGFTYLSDANFKLTGTKTLRTALGTSNDPVTVGTDFPAAWTLGVSNQCLENWKFLGEFVWTQYSKDQNLSTSSNGVGGAPILLNWKDEYNFRLAAEYKGFSWPIRFGYIWTSQVTDADYALPVIAPPGAAKHRHTWYRPNLGQLACRCGL